jgi:hypothetical protein
MKLIIQKNPKATKKDKNNKQKNTGSGTTKSSDFW